MALKTYPIPADRFGHRTRFSDSSFYDEVCVTCGATDAGSDLNRTCVKQVSDEEHAAERLATAKRQLIGMGSTHVQMLREHGPQNLSEFWEKKLPEIADLLELLLEERKTITAPLVANVTADVGDALLKDKTPEEQEAMRAGFAKWFDIQRVKSEELKGPKKDIVFYIDGVEVHRVKDADNVKGDIIEWKTDRTGTLTWSVEVNGVTLPGNQFSPSTVSKDALVKLTDYKASLRSIKAKPVAVTAAMLAGDEPPTPEVLSGLKEQKVGADEFLDQHARDQADAIDFGVTYEAVKMAREAYEAVQAKTHLFFMADWNKLARFKRRGLSRHYLTRSWSHQGE